MKRLIIAILLPLTVIALCALTLLSEHRAADTLIAECDKLTRLCREEDYAQLYRQACAFETALRHTTRFFPYVLHHDRLEQLYTGAAALPLLAKDEDAADFLAAVSTLRMQLTLLRDSETPTLSAIF